MASILVAGRMLLLVCVEAQFMDRITFFGWLHMGVGAWACGEVDLPILAALWLMLERVKECSGAHLICRRTPADEQSPLETQ